MRVEDRQKILHEGAGQQSLAATVEIIFDNTDGRLPVERKGDVSIKRVMWLKKDEYFIDGKHVTRADLSSLLEGAGMSASNPYFFVRQGRVMELVKMSDEDRLKLLMDVAGTSAYEERRAESLRIMATTDRQREEVEEVMGSIEARLEDLAKEKDVLEKWEKLQRQKTVLQHVRLSRAIGQVDLRLRELGGGDTGNAALWQERATASAARAQAELAHADVVEQVAARTRERTRYENELGNYKALCEEHEAQAKQAEQAAAEEMKLLHAAERELTKVETMTSETEAARDAAAARVRATEEELHKTESELAQAESELMVLNARVGVEGVSSFANEAERQAYITGQLDAVKEEGRAAQKALSTANKELERVKKVHAAAVERVSIAVEEDGRSQAALTDAMAVISASEARLRQIEEQQRDLLRNLTEARTAAEQAETALRAAQRALDAGGAGSAGRAAELVREIVSETGLRGVYGPLGALTTCQKIFAPCIETVAGPRLAHIVCDNDDTAATLLREVLRRGGARVTALPANRLLVRDIRVEKKDGILLSAQATADAAAMWSGGDGAVSSVTRALQSVLGGTVVVKDLKIGAEVSQRLNIDCITSACDTVSRDGVYKGGWRAKEGGMLSLWREWGAAERAHHAAREQVRALSEQRAALARAETAASEERETALGRVSTARMALSQAASALVSAREDATNALGDVERRQLAVEGYTQAVARAKEAEASLVALQKDKGKVSNADVTRARKLGETVAQLRTQLSSLRATLRDEQLSVSELTRRINDVLRPRAAKLKSALEARAVGNVTLTMSLSMSAAGASMLDASVENVVAAEALRGVASARAQVEAIEARLKELDKELTALHKREATAETAARTAKEKEAAVLARANAAERSAIGVTGERAGLEHKRAMLTSELVGLGAVDERERRAAADRTDLEKKLSEITGEMQKLGRVNPHAAAQWAAVGEERVALEARLSELDAGRAAIMELLAELDSRKSEAVQRTVRAVAGHFARVFEELVPDGKATLVMRTAGGTGDGEEEEGKDEAEAMEDREEKPKKGRRNGKEAKKKEEAKTAEPAANELRGIGMRVSFTGQPQANARLSGGQKTVSALALLVALQRADPSPVYLLDEVDANLDAAFRTAVAGVIKEMGNRAQVICTTFREELLSACDKHYLVEFADRESRVSVVSARLARDVVLETARQ